jgi:hypothetical protein
VDFAEVAQVSFEVYPASTAAIWQQRMRDWIAGNLDTMES